MKTKLIAFSGNKAVGKDTSAKMLRYMESVPKHFRYYWLYKILDPFIIHRYKITSFAHPLKRTLASMLNINIKLFENRDFKENTYIYFPTLEITKYPPAGTKLSDNRFIRGLENKDYSFIKSNYLTIRQLLQFYGTNVMRDIFGERIWIILSLKQRGRLIISDLRFRAELEEVHSKKGIVAYIKRDCIKAGNHTSEREVKEIYEENKYDLLIDNNGTLKDLFYEIKNKFYGKNN